MLIYIIICSLEMFLLPPRLPTLSGQCYSNRLDNLDNLGRPSRNMTEGCDAEHCEHFTCACVIPMSLKLGNCFNPTVVSTG